VCARVCMCVCACGVGGRCQQSSVCTSRTRAPRRNNLEKSVNRRHRSTRGKLTGENLRTLMWPLPSPADHAHHTELSWDDLWMIFHWDERQTPRVTKLTKSHLDLDTHTRMRCHLATEGFAAVVLYGDYMAKFCPSTILPERVQGLIAYCRMFVGLHAVMDGVLE
jgi:hypothetical protein